MKIIELNWLHSVSSFHMEPVNWFVSGFDKLLQLFDFADKYRGKYDSSITVAQKYYRSISGYNVSVLVQLWTNTKIQLLLEY